MRVNTERDGRGLVAERPLNSHHVAASRDEGARVEVPQIVEGVLLGQSSILARVPPVVPCAVAVDAITAPEEQPSVLALGADVSRRAGPAG